MKFWDEYAAATTFPSSEYVDEKVNRFFSLSNPEGMAPSGPPVWRSQLMSPPPPISVKRWPSGERLSCRLLSSRCWEGIEKVSSRLRVVASRVTTDLSSTIAITLLHGDQIVSRRTISLYKVAAIGSQEDGSPRTTLARGRVYCLYSLCMIEV